MSLGIHHDREQMQHTSRLQFCLCCNGSKLKPYLDLGIQPPPNAFHKESEEVQKFPLEIQVCQQCWHSQVVYAVKPDILFQHYPYRTGVSQTLIEHYNNLARASADHVKGLLPNEKEPAILDIGCNDGTLLRAFGKLGFDLYGADPCNVLVNDGNNNDTDKEIKLREMYWGSGGVPMDWMGKFHIITATNVLAHNAYPKQFMRDARKCIHYRGIMVLEFPYAKDLINECLFDTMYHEHVSYFLMSSFHALIKDTGWAIEKANVIGVHGGSLRIILRPCILGCEFAHDENVRTMKNDEQSLRLYTVEPYNQFENNVDSIRHRLYELIKQDSVNDPFIVAGFGASGKGTVMLNKFNLPMQYILDETPAKQGLLSPGKDIPVYGLEYLRDNTQPRRTKFVIMSWNCLRESIDKLKTNHPDQKRGDTFITYVPELKEEKLFPLESLQ